MADTSGTIAPDGSDPPQDIEQFKKRAFKAQGWKRKKLRITLKGKGRLSPESKPRAKARASTKRDRAAADLGASRQDILIPQAHWDMIPQQVEKSTLGVRFLPADPSAKITEMRLAGRPRGKHGGEQGQHSTAFVTLRETVVAAVGNQTAAKATERMLGLIKTLELYPGVEGDGLVAARQLASDLESGKINVEEAAVFYLELRDAMPGASLPGSTPDDTNGKGEGSTVAKLRAAEAGGSLDDAALADLFLGLFDMGVLEKLSPEDQAKQVETFLLSTAQAYPDLFAQAANHLWTALTEAVEDKSLLPATSDLEQKITTCIACLLPMPEEARPHIPPFCATLKTEPGDRFAFDFTNRPGDSIHDGGLMGDHTTCFRLMGKSMNGALLDDGKMPSKDVLVEKLADAARTFDPKVYLDPLSLAGILQTHAEVEFHAGAGPDDVLAALDACIADEKTFNTLGSQTFMPYLQRLSDMRRQWLNVVAEINRLQASDEDVDANLLVDCAEMLVGLVDQRPTAVIYNALASGHAEAHTGQALDGMEATCAKGQAPDEQVFLTALLGQFDVGAAHSGPLDDAYRTCVVREFVWFAERAYPLCMGAVGSERVAAAVHDAVLRYDPPTRGAKEDEEDFSKIDPDTLEPRKKIARGAKKPIKYPE